MQTINVKLLPQTETKPTRIKVWAEGIKPVIKSVPHDAPGYDEAMVKFAYDFKMAQGWTGKMVGGHTDSGMVFVFINDNYVIE